MTIEDTTSQAFFEEKYKRSCDPWAFATSGYEQQRYAAILGAIGHRNYRHAFEPGCSIGVLTEQLASLCDRLDATDISPTAVAQTQRRTQHLSNVQTTCGALPALIPDGNFDLIVFSEIGYYFSEDALFSLARELVYRNCKSGVFLAAHWLGESPDHLLSGDRVHEVLSQVPNLSLQHAERHPGFRLDVWTRT
jgi:trans-aconitate methyltransferase